MTATYAQLPSAPGRNGQTAKKAFKISRGRLANSAKRIVIYGTGGVGKTTLARAFGDVTFVDFERSDYDMSRVEGIESWPDLRAWLQSADTSGAIGIDSASKAEALCTQYVCDTVPVGNNGAKATSLESFGYGKGYAHLADEWKRFLGDLDRLHLNGKTVILICHERVGKVPNPGGEDFIRYEPRLYNSPNASIMHMTKEWADEVWFVGYDVMAKDGKAKGSGTRTIYVTEQATHVAKTRNLTGEPIIFARDNPRAIWDAIGGAANNEIPL